MEFVQLEFGVKNQGGGGLFYTIFRVLKGVQSTLTVVKIRGGVDWFGLVCFAIKNKNCQLSYSQFQTSQTGGQWYSYTSPLVFSG